MSLIVLEKLSLAFGGRAIVDELDLRIGESDRVGLIGPNGSGKTTLLRLLAGDQAPDGGGVRRARGASVGWLPQDLAIEGGRPLLDFVRAAVPGKEVLDEALKETEASYAEANRLVSEGGGPEAEERLLEEAARLSELHARLADFDLRFSEHEALRILAGLGFPTEDKDRDIGELSGGWKMRAVLASLLFQQPDLLLLDEPTNHLDMPSVAWFSDFLKRYRRAFVLISHDREFLNEQIDRVVSFEVEGVRTYPGDYEAYLKQRAEEEEILENKANNLEREREKALQFINRFRAQASKAKAVQSRIKALEKMESVETYRKRRVMSFHFAEPERSGHEVIRVRGVTKRYGEREVLHGVNATVYRGDRVGIIGPNGAGKTTLLKIIAGDLGNEGGEVELGHNVKAGYYAQHQTELLHPKNTILDEVWSQNRELGQTRVRTVLGSFLFSGDDIEKPISVLSGGEKARVALAKLLVDPGNLLLLDEPTNHLDLQSCESLIGSLGSYEGTMVFVSHNRSLIRRLATKIWSMEEGRVVEYQGNLDDYLDQSRARLSGEEVPEPAQQKSQQKSQQASSKKGKKSEPRKKLSREEEKARKRREAEERRKKGKGLRALKKKVAELEGRIEELESEQEVRNAQLCDPGAFADEKERFEVLSAMQVAADKLEELHMRWERAAEELEKAEAG